MYRYIALLFESSVDARPVEADDDLTVDVDDRDAHLAGFVDGFFGEGWIFFDVLFCVFDAEFFEVVLDGVTKGAPVGAVDGNGMG